MHRDQNPAFLDSAFVSLCLVFRNAETDQASGNSAHDASGADTGKGRKDRTGRDKRTDTRDSDGAYSCQPTHNTADHSACAGTCGSSLGGFRRFFVAKIFGSFVIRIKNRNILRAKIGFAKRYESFF